MTGSDLNGLTTLVVHTPERAQALEALLQLHGIKAVLRPLEGDHGIVPAPVAVMIPESDLSQGLKVLESGDTVATPKSMFKIAGLSRHLLIPVDFSSPSMTAVKLGFTIADKFGIEPFILHAYTAPVPASPAPFDSLPDSPDMEVVAEDEEIESLVSSQLSKFKRKIKEAQDAGELPAVKFSTQLLEGVPESVIVDYCKLNNPFMVIMATRDRNKKESDLIGSVTAEVMDSVRIPVFSFPDNSKLRDFKQVKRILLFCDNASQDILTVRALMSAFGYPSCQVYLTPVGDPRQSSVRNKMDSVRKYLTDTFPTAQFHEASMPDKDFRTSLNHIISEHDIQLIIMPNKKSNAFSRLFKPTLAHKCLFDCDVPLLAIPV